MRHLFLGLILCSSSTFVMAEGVLHKADFESEARPKNWSVNFGHWEPEDGYLVCRQVEKDKHAAASRWQVPLKDGVIECRVRLVGAKQFHIGFDPDRKELNKKGHLYSLIITPNGAISKEHKDKADENSEDHICANIETPLPQFQWFNVRLETTGNIVNVAIAERIKMKVQRNKFGVQKPSVVFRTIGGDAHLDDVHVLVKK